MHITEMTTGMVRGDEDAYAVFHREYQPRVYRYIFVLLAGRLDETLDVTQETLLRVIRHVRPFSCEQVFWDWLTCLARSAAADHGRRTSRWARLLRILWSQPPAANTQPELEEITPFVERAIALLSTEDQSLLAAKYSGSSVRELAIERGLSEGAVESRLFRLRARIREQVLEWKRHESE